MNKTSSAKASLPMPKGKWAGILFAVLMIPTLVTAMAFIVVPKLVTGFSGAQLPAQDLSQQALMAWGTWAIFFVSALGLAFSGIGIYLLARTLTATKAAADAAEISAKAAAAALKQDRAWMTPVGLIEVRERFAQTQFIFGWDNTGRTPALNVNTGFDLRLVEGGIPASMNIDAQLYLEDQFVIGKNSRAEGVIGPGNRIRTAVSIPSGILIERMCPDRTGQPCSVIINLNVRYESIYEVTHESMATFTMDICCGKELFYNPSKSQKDLLVNIDLRPVGLQNYAN